MTRTHAAVVPAEFPPARADRSAIPGVGLACLGLALGGGLPGFGLAAVLLAAWVLLPPVAVATLGVFLLAGTSGQVWPVVTGAGLAGVLLGPLVRDAGAPEVVVASVVALAVVLGAGVTATLASTSLPIAAGVLLVLAGLASYAIHRYQLVVTGVASLSPDGIPGGSVGEAAGEAVGESEEVAPRG